VEEDVGCLEGIRAYAAKQASIRLAFTDHFQFLWSPFLSLDAIALSNVVFSAADLPDLLVPAPPDV
jgi:hypothetical protein